MDLKKSFFGFALKNILIASAIVAVLIWITFKCINSYTEHGITETVPDLRGAYVEEADVILREKGLHVQVIDSVYLRSKKLGTIIEQIPAPNSIMKRNRPVYLIINSRQVRQIALPKVTDFSARQAAAMINALGIKIDTVQHVPSEYKDLVMDVKYKGRSIEAGYKVPEGEGVVLVVGRGLGDEEIVVPRLKGLTLEVARQEIILSSFVLGGVNYDEDSSENDGNAYLIYHQVPEDGTLLPSGSRIDVWLSTDHSKRIKTNQNGNQDEEFF